MLSKQHVFSYSTKYARLLDLIPAGLFAVPEGCLSVNRLSNAVLATQSVRALRVTVNGNEGHSDGLMGICMHTVWGIKQIRAMVTSVCLPCACRHPFAKPKLNTKIRVASLLACDVIFPQQYRSAISCTVQIITLKNCGRPHTALKVTENTPNRSQITMVHKCAQLVWNCVGSNPGRSDWNQRLYLKAMEIERQAFLAVGF